MKAVFSLKKINLSWNQLPWEGKSFFLLLPARKRFGKTAGIAPKKLKF
jgi:hypothetical protein